MVSWALSGVGEPHSLGISPEFSPRGANAFAPYTSPISAALRGQSAGRNWLSSSHCPSNMTHSARAAEVRGAPVSPPVLVYRRSRDGAGPAGPALSGCGLVNGPDNSGAASAALLLSLLMPRPLSSPCSHKTLGSEVLVHLRLAAEFSQSWTLLWTLKPLR